MTAKERLLNQKYEKLMAKADSLVQSTKKTKALEEEILRKAKLNKETTQESELSQD